MSLPRHFLKWVIVLLVVAAAGYGIWRATRPKPLEVVVKAVTRGTVERTVANTRAGTVKACRRAKLSPSVGGQIAQLPIREGDAVTEGQLLLEIWNEDLEAQAVLAERQVVSARSRARSACLRAGVSQRNADRLKKLRKQDVVTEERADNVEAEAAAFLDVGHAVGLNSGTDALILALEALGIKAGDEVITTPFTFAASANCILFESATPVFADIDPARMGDALMPTDEQTGSVQPIVNIPSGTGTIPGRTQYPTPSIPSGTHS